MVDAEPGTFEKVTEGFKEADVTPFPKSQKLIMLPVELLVNVTGNGEHPETGVPVKFATGDWNMITDAVAVLTQPVPLDPMS